MHAKFEAAKRRRDEAAHKAVADPRLGPYEVNEARHAAEKNFCIELGREVLTPAACAFLFARSAPAVRARRRARPDDAIAFTLRFGSGARDVHMLRLEWARTVWPEPKDYAERLETLRRHGHVMGMPSGAPVLILSPTPIWSTPVQTLAAEARYATMVESVEKIQATREKVGTAGVPGVPGRQQTSAREEPGTGVTAEQSG